MGEAVGATLGSGRVMSAGEEVGDAMGDDDGWVGEALGEVLGIALVPGRQAPHCDLPSRFDHDVWHR